MVAQRGWCGWRGEKWLKYGYLVFWRWISSECASGIKKGYEKKSQRLHQNFWSEKLENGHAIYLHREDS